MMRKLFWRKKDDDSLQRMEAILQENLSPVTPRPDFVTGLRRNLLVQFPLKGAAPVPSAPSPRAAKIRTGVLVTSGVFGGVLLVISGVRGVISLVAAIAFLVSWFRQNARQGDRSTT